jgi:hypothetical protein
MQQDAYGIEKYLKCNVKETLPSINPEGGSQKVNLTKCHLKKSKIHTDKNDFLYVTNHNVGRLVYATLL